MTRRPRYPNVREKNFYKKKDVPRLTHPSPTQMKHFSKGRKWLDTYATRVRGKWYDYWAPSPNQSERPSKYKTKKNPNGVHGIVIHTTEGWGSPAKSFSKRSRGASSHYGVERDGSISYIVDESKKAWHAGTSVNDWSVGIEVVGFSVEDGISKGLKGGKYKPMGFPTWQMEALAKLVAGICHRNKLKPNKNTIFGHRHSGGCGSRESSGRAYAGRPVLQGKGGGKGCHYDPGNNFPWKRFMKRVRWYYYKKYFIGAAVIGVLGVSGVIAYLVLKKTGKLDKLLPGSTNAVPSITLYFLDGCPYSGRVRDKLDELQLVYEPRRMDVLQNKMEVREIRGDGKQTTPLMILDGKAYADSTKIINLLEKYRG